MKVEFSKYLELDFKKTHELYIKEKNIGGICFGASLQWAVDVLRLLAGDKTSAGLDIINRTRFMNVSHKNQSAYEHIFTKSPQQSKIIIADILNRQEDFLSHRYDYKMRYSVKDGDTIDILVKDFLNNEPEYNNTALIISTALYKPAKFLYNDTDYRHSDLSHATALVNHKGKNYFFDINKGIFKLPGNYSIAAEKLCELILENFDFGMSYIPGNPYEFSYGFEHLFIELEKMLTPK